MARITFFSSFFFCVWTQIAYAHCSNYRDISCHTAPFVQCHVRWSVFCSFHPRFQNEIIKWFCCEESAQRAAANISRSHLASALSCQDSIHHSAAKITFAGNLFFFIDLYLRFPPTPLQWRCTVPSIGHDRPQKQLFLLLKFLLEKSVNSLN